jgi:thiamine-phosphate diphosphorylase
MDWKKRALKSSRLCLILDRAVCGRRDPKLILTQAMRGGADMVQLRDKTSTTKDALRWMERLRPVIRQQRVLFIVNDRPDIALALDADGVHLGQDDMPVSLVRKIVGRRLLLGLSTSSDEEVRAAKNQDVDYLGFGPIFATQTKPDARAKGLDLMRRALAISRHPVYAIGGMTRQRLPLALVAGATRFAVCRDICCAPNVYAAAQQWKKTICTLT